MKLLAEVVLTIAVVLGTQESLPTDQQSPKVEAYLSADRNQYKPGQIVRVRIELRNVSGRPILVGREVSTIGNWPFSLWLRLVDSNGNYAQPVHGAYVDPPPKPDLSTKDGVLRWWTTLDPGYLYGRDVDFQLQALKEGQYELEGDYYSTGVSGAAETITANGDHIAALAGKLRAHPVRIEIVKPDSIQSR